MESLLKSHEVLVCSLPSKPLEQLQTAGVGWEVTQSSSSWNSLPGFTEGSIAAPAGLTIISTIVMRGSINTTIYLWDKCNSSLHLFICRAARSTGMTGI